MGSNTTYSKQRGVISPRKTSTALIFGRVPSRYGKPNGQRHVRTGTVDCLRHWTGLLLTALLFAGLWASPSFAFYTTNCIDCHGTFTEVHGTFTHIASPPSGQVKIFPDNGHDDSITTYVVTVDCTTCHATYLPLIHSRKEGGYGDCDICHPTLYDQLNPWGRGCQQGGCHTVFHAESTTAHLPFSNPFDSSNDCSRCHDPTTDAVTQQNCLNCHADPNKDYNINSTPVKPVTTSNAQATNYGAARIHLTINENGKIGIGRTFYILDGGTTTAGKDIVVNTPGSHTLEFWSVNQYGVREAVTNTVKFSVVEDSIPPTTTSNAKSSYNQGAVITLTATDNIADGVKATYYTINGGPTQTGTTVNIPATSGVITYTLAFWSEDWAGNVEAKHTVTFTVTSGGGTIRLIFYNSDTSPVTDPAGWNQWQVTLNGPYGTSVKSGSGASPTWTGVDDISVPISTAPYYVRIKWNAWWYGYYEVTDIPNIYISAPGQIVECRYTESGATCTTK